MHNSFLTVSPDTDNNCYLQEKLGIYENNATK